jgi:hypothetical protein
MAEMSKRRPVFFLDIAFLIALWYRGGSEMSNRKLKPEALAKEKSL